MGATPLIRKPRFSCRAFLAGLLLDVLFALARTDEPGLSPCLFACALNYRDAGVSVSLRFSLGL
jgi:hypothetical protein